jgi:hypothetical protein
MVNTSGFIKAIWFKESKVNQNIDCFAGKELPLGSLKLMPKSAFGKNLLLLLESAPHPP